VTLQPIVSQTHSGDKSEGLLHPQNSAKEDEITKDFGPRDKTAERHPITHDITRQVKRRIFAQAQEKPSTTLLAPYASVEPHTCPKMQSDNTMGWATNMLQLKRRLLHHRQSGQHHMLRLAMLTRLPKHKTPPQMLRLWKHRTWRPKMPACTTSQSQHLCGVRATLALAPTTRLCMVWVSRARPLTTATRIVELSLLEWITIYSKDNTHYNPQRGM